MSDYVFDFLLLRDEQARMSETYRATFSDAVAVQSHGLSKVQDTVQSVVESLEHVYGGLDDVSGYHQSSDRCTK